MSEIPRLTDKERKARDAAAKAIGGRILKGLEEFNAGWDAGRAFASQEVEELRERLVACEPRGECPVCGGETDHVDSCEVGVLTRRVEELRAALAELVRLRDLKENDPRQYEDEDAMGAKADAWVAARAALADRAISTIRRAVMDENEEIAVTMTRAQWQRVLACEPTNEETYTPEGIAIFNAFQLIHTRLGTGTEKQ